MKDPRFNKAIQDIQKLSMTAAEKTRIFEAALAARKKHAQPVKSPWTIYSFSTWVVGHRAFSFAIAAVLIVVLAGGGAVSASAAALPGDTLYGVKVNVVEPIRVAFAPNAAAKAEAQAKLADTRLAEAETLASEGKLDQAKENQLATLIDEHTAALGTSLDQVEKDSPEKANDITLAFETSARAHVRALAALSGQTVPALPEAAKIATSEPVEAPPAPKTMATMSMQVAPTSTAAPTAPSTAAPLVTSSPASTATSAASSSASTSAPANATSTPKTEGDSIERAVETGIVNLRGHGHGRNGKTATSTQSHTSTSANSEDSSNAASAYPGSLQTDRSDSGSTSTNTTTQSERGHGHNK